MVNGQKTPLMDPLQDLRSKKVQSVDQVDVTKRQVVDSLTGCGKTRLSGSKESDDVIRGLVQPVG